MISQERPLWRNYMQERIVVYMHVCVYLYVKYIVCIINNGITYFSLVGSFPKSLSPGRPGYLFPSPKHRMTAEPSNPGSRKIMPCKHCICKQLTAQRTCVTFKNCDSFLICIFYFRRIGTLGFYFIGEVNLEVDVIDKLVFPPLSSAKFLWH